MKETISRHQIKITVATVIGCIIFIIGSTLKVADTHEEMRHQAALNRVSIDNISNHFSKLASKVAILEENELHTRVELAKIQTQLSAIDSTLIEIKNRL